MQVLNRPFEWKDIVDEEKISLKLIDNEYIDQEASGDNGGDEWNDESWVRADPRHDLSSGHEFLDSTELLFLHVVLLLIGADGWCPYHHFHLGAEDRNHGLLLKAVHLAHCNDEIIVKVDN